MVSSIERLLDEAKLTRVWPAEPRWPRALEPGGLFPSPSKHISTGLGAPESPGPTGPCGLQDRSER